MSNFIKLLRHDIEHLVGFRITSNTQVKVLLEILNEENHSISESTIRRLWGLIASENTPSQNTLNQLTQFLGYHSYQDYTRQKSKFDIWHEDQKLQKIKFKDQLNASDFKIIELHVLKTQSLIPFVNIFEYAFYQKKWSYLHSLLCPEHLSFFSMKYYGPEINIGRLASLIQLFLFTLPEEVYKANLPHLIKAPNFRKFVTYCYINYIESNKSYGYMLDEIIKLDNTTEEEQLFIALFNGLKNYLNQNNFAEVRLIAIEKLHALPFPLVGRYYGYQLLYAKHYAPENYERYYKNLLDYATDKTTNMQQIFQEVVWTLLVSKQFEILNDVVDRFYEDIFDDNRYRLFADLIIYTFIDLIIIYINGDYKDALKQYRKLDVSLVKSGYHSSELTVFYHLLGYHFETETALKDEHRTDYLNYAEQTKFKRLNINYLENFFTVDFNTLVAKKKQLAAIIPI